VRILYHHRIASKDGQYVHVEEINKSLKKAGHEIVLVAPSVGEAQDFGGDGGLVSKLKARLPKALYELAEFGYTFWAFFKLCRAILRHRPDFIYERYNLLHPAGIWAKKLFRLPLLLEINSPLLEERSKYDGMSLTRLAGWAERYCWLQADVCLPVTQVLADYQRRVGVAEDRIRVIPNGINVEAFMQQPHPSPLPVDVSNKLVIGFVGFCRDWHGLDRIVELLALPGNEQLFFLLVGDGPAVPGLLKVAEEKGVSERMFVTGLVDRDAMPGWLTPIDIALQPAVVAYASPLKMLEYMATAKAIVAPDQPNIRELLSDEENALLFDPRDDNAFAAACNRLARDPALRERLAERARQTVLERNLTWDGNAATIVELAEQRLDPRA
jgi:glycosyltransferase involved in cell wall biosynthesis